MKKTIVLSAILTLGLLSAKGQIITVDNADAKTGWSAGRSSLSLDTKDVKEGKAALVSEGEDPYRFKKKFDNAVNTGVKVATGYLSFWFFIDNIDEVNQNRGFMEISSNGKGGEENSLRFQFNKWDLNKGWNYVLLNLEDAKGRESFTGEIKSILLFQRGTSTSSTFKLDNIRFSKSYGDLKLK